MPSQPTVKGSISDRYVGFDTPLGAYTSGRVKTGGKYRQIKLTKTEDKKYDKRYSEYVSNMPLCQ